MYVDNIDYKNLSTVVQNENYLLFLYLNLMLFVY